MELAVGAGEDMRFAAGMFLVMTIRLGSLSRFAAIARWTLEPTK